MPESPLRVLSILGTRPEAVKMAPVIAELDRRATIQSAVCVTAQHREMLDQVLALFQIKPAYDLNLMRHNQSLDALTAAVFTHLAPVLEDVQPDWVLVQGDTTTVMAAALAATYHRIRVGHVEAGLRTRDKWNPFPEEINRRVAGCISDLHFAPTEQARKNLLAEGVDPARIVLTGNPVIDALQQVVTMPYNFQSGPLAEIDECERVVLVTAHRRENFGEPLERIFGALQTLAEAYPHMAFVYPVHLNPNVQEPARRLLGGIPNFHLLPPLDYLPMAHLLKRAELVLTDSGGLQEEAPALGTPVLVLRDVTERPEGVEAGTALVVGTDPSRIVTETRRLLDDPQAYAAMAQAVNPYGDGRAAGRIVDGLLQAVR